jgi:SAM-dependent methyltransferase
MTTQELDKEFWNTRYVNNQTGWDLGEVSPPLKTYIDQITNKNKRILIPGSGNAYELDYLLKKGFTNLTIIDIAPKLVENLKERHCDSNAKIIQGNFFELNETYDLILEQTFFCAIEPSFRKKYVQKTHDLLSKGGKLCGVLFDRNFEGGPPFGGNKRTYQELFKDLFTINKLEECYNSHPARQGNEVWIEMLRE